MSVNRMSYLRSISNAPLSGPVDARTSLKEVGAQETTLRFWQGIYDEENELVEVHPLVDEGRRRA